MIFQLGVYMKLSFDWLLDILSVGMTDYMLLIFYDIKNSNRNSRATFSLADKHWYVKQQEGFDTLLIRTLV